MGTPAAAVAVAIAAAADSHETIVLCTHLFSNLVRMIVLHVQRGQELFYCDQAIAVRIKHVPKSIDVLFAQPLGLHMT